MFGQSLLSGAFGSAACTTDTDQLFTSDATATSLATYQLNNATTSIPSNTYPGAATNVTYASGKFGQAANFNASISYVNMGTSLATALRSAQAFTVSCWINIASMTQNAQFIHILDNTYLFGALNSNGTIYARLIQSNGTQREIQGSTVLSTSNWYNVNMTGSSATGFTLYVNGVSQGNLSWDGTFTTYSSPYYGFNLIGSGSNDGTSQFNGLVDQVRIFTTALPQSAVTALYNETVATSSSASINYVAANPNSIAYYKMSDATDQLGNFNGTATNVNFNTEGKFGFAGAFNGSSSKIAISDISPKSISMWVNLDTLNRYDALIGNSSNTSNYIYWADSSENYELRLGSLRFGSGTSKNTVGVVGSWVNVIFVNSGSTTTCYINGTSAGSVAASLSSYNEIGARTAGGDQWLDGKIDQIRIYDSALSAANVTTLYEEIECPAATIVNSFNTVLYTGNGGTQSISSVGFKPDFTWLKNRNTTNWHALQNTISGATKHLYSNARNAEDTTSNGLTSFDNNGFTLGGANGFNASGENSVAWNWKGGGAASDITSSSSNVSVSKRSANAAAGFSIVTYTINSSSPVILPHGLNSTPKLAIVKKLNSASDWFVYNSFVSGVGRGFLNNSNAFDNAGMPTLDSTNITFLAADPFDSPDSAVIYFFSDIPGYSRIGSYVGTGAAGNVQYLGFEPSFILVKRTDSSGGWFLIDNKRNTSNPRNTSLEAQGNYQDNTLSSVSFDFDANSLEVNGTNAQINTNGGEYIFLAIA